MKFLIFFHLVIICLLPIGCSPDKNDSILLQTDENGVAILCDAQIEEIVRRSYQYIALYNVNQKLAFAEEGLSTKGNKTVMQNHGLHYSYSQYYILFRFIQ